MGRCHGSLPGLGPLLHQLLVLFACGVLLVGLRCRNPTHTGECPHSAEAAELGSLAEGRMYGSEIQGISEFAE